MGDEFSNVGKKLVFLNSKKFYTACGILLGPTFSRFFVGSLPLLALFELSGMGERATSDNYSKYYFRFICLKFGRYIGL